MLRAPLRYVPSIFYVKHNQLFSYQLGDRQPANLGDGNGWMDEMVLFSLEDLLNHFNLPPDGVARKLWIRFSRNMLGKCYRYVVSRGETPIKRNTQGETIYCINIQFALGILKFIPATSVYRQDGPAANSGALFLAYVFLLKTHIAWNSYEMNL